MNVEIGIKLSIGDKTSVLQKCIWSKNAKSKDKSNHIDKFNSYLSVLCKQTRNYTAITFVFSKCFLRKRFSLLQGMLFSKVFNSHGWIVSRWLLALWYRIERYAMIIFIWLTLGWQGHLKLWTTKEYFHTCQPKSMTFYV